jgi:hypothetical protein
MKFFTGNFVLIKETMCFIQNNIIYLRDNYWICRVTEVNICFTPGTQWDAGMKDQQIRAKLENSNNSST